MTSSPTARAPTVHVTVMSLTNDSHFGSGFANLVYNPTLNCIRARPRASSTSPTGSRFPAGHGQSGMLPCLRRGPGWRLFSSVSSAVITLGRVSCGTITSSM